MRSALSVVTLGILAAAATGQPLKPVEKQPAKDLAPGTYLGTSKQKRPFLFRIPDTVDPARPPNLIVMLHGTGMSYHWGFVNYGVHNGYFRPWDIVVSPESEVSNRGFVQDKPDRLEVANLIKRFRKLYPIGNVYLYGHSQGAFFCYHFAGEMPELVDGIVGHAGNFFRAKTNKKAQNGVAVGVMHGRADAVVDVLCAFRTDLIYRKAGYRNVKLMVVEGLNERTGHWPLQYHLPRVLAWIDAVAAKNTRAALDAALREMLREKDYDLAVIARATSRAREFASKESKEQRPALEKEIGILEQFLGKVQESLAIEGLAERLEGGYGPWTTAARWAIDAFGADRRWQETHKNLAKLSTKHQKLRDKALKDMAKYSKSAGKSGLKVLERGYLCPGYDHVALHTDWLIRKSGSSVDEKTADAIRTLVRERRRVDEKGRDDVRKRLRPLFEAFRKEQATLLAPFQPKKK